MSKRSSDRVIECIVKVFRRYLGGGRDGSEPKGIGLDAERGPRGHVEEYKQKKKSLRLDGGCGEAGVS